MTSTRLRRRPMVLRCEVSGEEVVVLEDEPARERCPWVTVFFGVTYWPTTTISTAVVALLNQKRALRQAALVERDVGGRPMPVTGIGFP